MAVLFDYLDWRGDLSFQIDPDNEVDYYMISKIGCPDLTEKNSEACWSSSVPWAGTRKFRNLRSA